MYPLPLIQANTAPPAQALALCGCLPGLLPRFTFLDRQAPDRKAAELFIARRFAEAYGAELKVFLPLLLSMHCGSQCTGIAGVSLAGRGELFLEQYLDDPVEQVLEAITSSAWNRDGIVEIGNLVAVGRGSSLALFIILACACEIAGYETLVFTATSALRNRFTRLGFVQTEIVKARPDRLPGAGDCWGAYYGHDPRVVAGRVDQAVAVIRRRRLLVYFRSLLDNQIIGLGRELCREHA